MNKREDMAINLMNLFEEGSYKEFGEGFFVNRPKLTGWYYIFQDIKEPKFCLVLNNSTSPYQSTLAITENYAFIVFNVTSVEEFIENLSDKYLPEILEIISEHWNKKDERNLPYGYYYDENGDLKIDPQKAVEVREIYNRYLEVESVRQIAKERKTNFSFIRDILHDSQEYMQMQQKIIPKTIIEQVSELLAENVKGGRIRKETFKDRLAAVKQR